MAREVLIVADDLTGALDVAGPFASRGHDTHVAVDPVACRAAALADAEVLSINVTSRHLATAQAAALVRDTVVALCPRPPAIVIKKIDSTLRGNVAAETLALLDATVRRIAIVAPAFPAQGRTVSRGIVHVDGRPLADTTFARDALSPPPLDALDVVFARAAPDATVRVVAAAGPCPIDEVAGRTILVIDTQTDADLDRIVTVLGDRLDECVLVGSAGIAGAVARTRLAWRPMQAASAAGGEIAVVVGSRAEATALQLAALRARNDVAMLDLPNGIGALDELLAAPAPILVLRATTGAVPGDAAEVARALGAAAMTLLQRRPVEVLVATGGDTAIAILDALSCAHLRVLREVLPGIPCSELDVLGRKLRLLTKAGGFGRENTYVELIERLRAPPG